MRIWETRRRGAPVVVFSALVLLVGCGDGGDRYLDAGDDDREHDGGDQVVDGAVVDGMGVDGEVVDGSLLDADVIDATTLDAAVMDADVIDAVVEADAMMARLTVVVGDGGTVTGGGIDCDSTGGTCAVDVVAGAVVTLTASPGVGYGFDGWTGACAGQGATATVTVTGDVTCGARFLGVSGEVLLVEPPASVVPNVTEDDGAIVLFKERAGVVLGAGLAFDLHVPGSYVAAPGAPGEVAAGTEVDAYFFHFDPVGTPTTSIARTATVVLPDEVLAVQVLTAALEAGDAAVGASGVTYPTAGTHVDRQLELISGQDSIQLGADRRTVQLTFRTTTSADQIRIITRAEGAAVPRLTSTSAAVVAPPASVVLGATEASAAATVFVESSGPLAGVTQVDVFAPGTYTSASQITGATLAAGQQVTSYLVHFDPVGTATVGLRGTITFQGQIRGIQLTSATLDGGDGALGHPAVTYPVGDAARGLELASNEVLLWAADDRSLRFDLTANTGVDHLRVLVAE